MGIAVSGNCKDGRDRIVLLYHIYMHDPLHGCLGECQLKVLGLLKEVFWKSPGA